MEISQTLIIGSWINAKAQGFVGVSASVEGSFKGLVWDVWGLGFGGFRNFGVHNFWRPYDKDPTIYGTILGSPIFGNSHMGSMG